MNAKDLEGLLDLSMGLALGRDVTRTYSEREGGQCGTIEGSLAR